MTRRRAAAVVIALLVAGVAWWLSSMRDDVVATAPAERADSAPESPTPSTETPPAAATTASKPVVASRARRRREPSTDEPTAPAPTSAVAPTKSLFRGRAVFEDGRPAVGARVRAYKWSVDSKDATGRVGGEGVVGDDGSFEIRAAPNAEGDRCALYGVLSGYPYVGLVQAPSPDDVTLRFVRGGIVTGTVYGADGRALSGASVRLARCDSAGRVATAPGSSLFGRPDVAAFYTPLTTTDAGGRFRFEGAPLATESEKHSVVVVEDDDGTPWRSDVARFETSDGELVRDVHVGAQLFDSYDPLRRVEGRVRDERGAPIEGADVLYGVLDGGMNDERGVATTDDAGRFVLDLGGRFASKGRRVEVRVAAVGFWTWRGAPPAKPYEILRVRMTRWDREPRPCRVLGTATDSSDRPIPGRLLVDLRDEFFYAHRQWVEADERGAFTLEGLWHGTWRISVDDGQPVEVAVRDGDEVRVRLRATHDAASLAVQPAPERMTKLLEVQRVRVAELKERKAKLAESGQPKDALDAALESALDDLLQTEAKRRDELTRREVIVTGVPRDGSYVVGAQRDGRTWRVEARDGVARFPSLSIETWAFTIERFGIGTAPRDVDIVEGEGPQTVEVSLPR